MRLFDLIKRKLFREPPPLVDCVRDKEWYERKYGKEVNEYMKWEEDFEDGGSPGDLGIFLKNSSFKDLPLNSKPSEWKPHSGDVIKFIEEVIKFIQQIEIHDTILSTKITVNLSKLENIIDNLGLITMNLKKYEKSKELREELKRERYNSVIYSPFHGLNGLIDEISDDIKKLDKESELYKNIVKILYYSRLMSHISHMILFNRSFKDY